MELVRERFDLIAINLWGDREVTGFLGEPTTEKAFASGLEVQFTPTMLLLDAEGRVESGRPLVVMFEQPSCGACDELHLEILRREPVAYALSNLDAAIVNTWATDPVQIPDGRDLPAKDWARELGIEYTPSLVFFDAAGNEVFRTEGYLKSFHVHGAMDYVATGAYLRQPNFQRYLQERRTALVARGFTVDLME